MMIGKQIMGEIKVNNPGTTPVTKVTGHTPVTDGTGKRNKDLKKACNEFESIFTYQLLKSMRRTVEKSDLFHGGQGEEIYESFLDQELSKNLAGSGHNSLARLLYGQLKSEDTTSNKDHNDAPHVNGVKHGQQPDADALLDRDVAPLNHSGNPKPF